MLRNKDIQNLSELKSTFVDMHKKSDFIFNFIDILKLGKLHGVFSNVKQKGIPALTLIRLLLAFPFIDQKSVFGFTKSYWQQFGCFGKDAYYRLKNNERINWRNFLFGVVKIVINTLEKRENETDNQSVGPKALIFDDTVMHKTGKAIEGISKIWDHAIQKSVLGFQLLVLGYYDGTMFIPIDFSIHRAKGANKKKIFGLRPKDYKKQFRKSREKGTAGFKRKKELDITKIKSAVKMIKSAKKRGIEAAYVLTDSWFTCKELVQTTIENGMNYIGMFSKIKTNFVYQNKCLSYKQIRNRNRKKVKRNRRFKLYYIQTVVEWNGQKVVLLFTRKGKKGKWKCIISSDISLSVSEILEIYSIRWTIEVFFKECKQSLNLGKGQSNDFDAQIADTTIVMVQYLFLAIQNRIDKYETLGKLFKGTKENLLELRLHQRLIALLIAIIEIIEDLFDSADDEEVIKKIINNEELMSRIIRLVNSDYDEIKLVA